MASMLLHCALLAAGNVDHWLSSCRCACCSSLLQRSIGCFSETEAAATAMSLQLRAISNFGTWSATATTKWELKIIIENEIGMYGLLLIFGLDRSPFSPKLAAFVYAKKDRQKLDSCLKPMSGHSRSLNSNNV
jgi:hypothetical protein